ncbi:hypothetical protein H5410_002574 [Solanum commersonii]|uniref:Uncharacterized protein n=1 Tax=Solanum commersonii TaxID=4109 RepID=A0A9J6B2B3_SOLCO|nr:hypothetical protein H5410_002574 [Solanum commersonii]
MDKEKSQLFKFLPRKGYSSSVSASDSIVVSSSLTTSPMVAAAYQNELEYLCSSHQGFPQSQESDTYQWPSTGPHPSATPQSWPLRSSPPE